MCAICGRAILLTDLELRNGLTVCRARRWCLISTLHGATEAQIEGMHAAAMDLALRSAETLSIRRGPRGIESHTRTDGLPKFVRLPT